MIHIIRWVLIAVAMLFALLIISMLVAAVLALNEESEPDQEFDNVMDDEE